jgi:hypothetical protein
LPTFRQGRELTLDKAIKRISAAFPCTCALEKQARRRIGVSTEAYTERRQENSVACWLELGDLGPTLGWDTGFSDWSVRIACVRAEFRTTKLQNGSVRSYRCINLPDGLLANNLLTPGLDSKSNCAVASSLQISRERERVCVCVSVSVRACVELQLTSTNHRLRCLKSNTMQNIPLQESPTTCPIQDTNCALCMTCFFFQSVDQRNNRIWHFYEVRQVKTHNSEFIYLQGEHKLSSQFHEFVVEQSVKTQLPLPKSTQIRHVK